MSEELKPCPFCGGRATMWHHDGGIAYSGSATVTCEECGVMMEDEADYHNLLRADDQVKDKWNRRSLDV